MKMIWDLTNKCNLKCKHCGAINLEQNKELNKIDIKNIINYISSFVSEVQLLGGEPLLYDNIFTILELLNENNISTKIVTNGQFNDTFAEKLIKNKIDTILVSLDGYKIQYNSQFKLIKPYSIIEKNNKYFLYNPKTKTKTQYTKEGINILRLLDKPISIKELCQNTLLKKDIIYEFLLQEKSSGKVMEIKVNYGE